jgi:hypothetical protein
MSNHTWLNTTVVRSTSVAPTYGFGMGEVCPQAAGASVAATMRKRHLDAIQATPGSAHVPWSPPVP